MGIGTMVEFFRDPSNRWGFIDATFMFALLGAELYAFLVMTLGYFQTIWSLRINIEVPVIVKLADGRTVEVGTIDMSASERVEPGAE